MLPFAVQFELVVCRKKIFHKSTVGIDVKLNYVASVVARVLRDIFSKMFFAKIQTP